jgi:Asp/Glu/hydantoin racemase
MPKLLLINPNTSASVTALLQTHAQRFAGDGTTVQTTTARFGAPYIACEASYAVAGHATLDAWAATQTTDTDAVLIGCFGDPGLMALRECSAVPVTGLAEAAFIQAAALGPYAIVTGGARWGPMLERLAAMLGFAPQLAGIHTVTQSGAELARDPVAAHAVLLAACQEAALRFGAKSVILGGAGLAGMAAAISSSLQVPVIDSVEAGVRHALHLAAIKFQATGDTAVLNRRFDFAWSGVSAELSQIGMPPNSTT